jgi:hypothetical protein
VQCTLTWLFLTIHYPLARYRTTRTRLAHKLELYSSLEGVVMRLPVGLLELSGPATLLSVANAFPSSRRINLMVRQEIAGA